MTAHDLAGLGVLVIGGGSGIGASTVELCRASGARTIAADLSLPSGPDTEPVDLTDEPSTTGLFARVAAEWGRLDVLVITAGRSLHRSIGAGVRADWDLLGVNLVGAAEAVRLAVPLLTGSPDAAIVTVASAVSRRSYPGMSTYAASKAGLVHWSRCAANELAPQGIRVNCVCPGPIDTPMLRADTPAEISFDELARRIGALTALGRIGTATEVAHAICFLVSRNASFITGAVLDVDGGESGHDGSH